MNVNNKTTRTFSITDITEDQAQDLINLVSRPAEDAYRSPGELETLNNLRQALLNAGVKRQHASEQN